MPLLIVTTHCTHSLRMAGGKRGGKSTEAPKSKTAGAGSRKHTESEQDKLSEQDVYDVDIDLDSPQAGKLC